MTKFDPIAAAKAAAAKSADLTKPTTGGGGGEYTPPKEGPTRLRFIGYVELGEHPGSAKFPKPRARAKFIFELSGRNHPPIENDDGEKFPIRMDFELPISNHENSNYVALFNRMNHKKDATTFPELLGGGYLGRVYHNKSGERTYANLNDYKEPHDINPPFVLDPETDDYREVKIDEPLSELRLFLWDFPSKPMWDSIYIDGEWPERKDADGKVIAPARSKNVFQNKIREALNFEGSLVQEIADTGGLELGEDDGLEPDEELVEDAQKPVTKPKSKAKPKAASAKEPVDESFDDDDIPF